MVQAGSVILVVVAALSATFKTTIKPALDIVGPLALPALVVGITLTHPVLQVCSGHRPT